MSFKPQHKSRCYCSQRTCKCRSSTNVKTATTKTKVATTKTKAATTKATSLNKASVNEVAKRAAQPKFIKIKRIKKTDSVPNEVSNNNNNNIKYVACSRKKPNLMMDNKSGTTQSQGELPVADPSRRQTTAASSEPRQSSAKNSISWSKESYENELYTERRRCYERNKIIFPQNNHHQHHPLPCDRNCHPASEMTDYLERFLAEDSSLFLQLQRFRLENAEDCFNEHRRNELKWQHTNNSLNDIRSNFMDLSSSKKSTSSSPSSSPPPPSSPSSLSPLLNKKRTEEDVRKLNRIYYNKLKSPLSKSYALVFQSY